MGQALGVGVARRREVLGTNQFAAQASNLVQLSPGAQGAGVEAFAQRVADGLLRWRFVACLRGKCVEKFEC